jgi:hypothetical protein
MIKMITVKQKHDLINAKFSINELAPNFVVDRYGINTLEYIDYRAILTLLAIREYFGCKVFVNTQAMQFRGLRMLPATDDGKGTRFAANGAHYHGRAFDISLDEIHSLEVSKALKSKRYIFPYVSRMYQISDMSLHFEVSESQLINTGEVEIIKKG